MLVLPFCDQYQLQLINSMLLIFLYSQKVLNPELSFFDTYVMSAPVYSVYVINYQSLFSALLFSYYMYIVHHSNVYVVVQFYPWFIFSFLLFLGMVMYDNNMIMRLKQKKRKFEPRIKLNHNIYMDNFMSRGISSVA